MIDASNDIMVTAVGSALTAATSFIAFLRMKDRRKVRVLERKVSALEASDALCKREVKELRADAEERERMRREEREKSLAEFRSMERDRYELTAKNNDLLVDKLALIERLAQASKGRRP